MAVVGVGGGGGGGPLTTASTSGSTSARTTGSSTSSANLFSLKTSESQAAPTASLLHGSHL